MKKKFYFTDIVRRLETIIKPNFNNMAIMG